MLASKAQPRHSAALTALLLALATPIAHADSFTITSLAAGVEAPTNITTNYETFSSPTYSGGNLTSTFANSGITGTYTGSYQLVAANQYGGAGGTGQFITLTGPATYTLSLSSNVNYFGLWFSALDAGNELQFYNNNTLVDTFLPSNYASLVGACPNASSGYCGNPNQAFLGQDANEQFAYLNFYDTSGSFNKIVFTETLSGAGFESDNQAVANLATGTGTTGTTLNATTPEPSSLLLLATGLVAAGFVILRRPAA